MRLECTLKEWSQLIDTEVIVYDSGSGQWGFRLNKEIRKTEEICVFAPVERLDPGQQFFFTGIEKVLDDEEDADKEENDRVVLMLTKREVDALRDVKDCVFEHNPDDKDALAGMAIDGYALAAVLQYILDAQEDDE